MYLECVKKKQNADGGPLLTVAVVRTAVSTSTVVASKFLTVLDSELSATPPDDLVVTSAVDSVRLRHSPLLEAAYGDILTEQHIKGSVDILKHAVADEYNRIEAVKNHAYLGGRVPAVMTACWIEGSVKSVASTSAHGFK